jgi:hypothetical protein
MYNNTPTKKVGRGRGFLSATLSGYPFKVGMSGPRGPGREAKTCW